MLMLAELARGLRLAALASPRDFVAAGRRIYFYVSPLVLIKYAVLAIQPGCSLSKGI